MPFAENLKIIKDASKMRNYKFAQFIGCSQTSVANWLNGEHLPHKKARIVIADAFGFTLDEIDGELPKDFEKVIFSKIKEPAPTDGDGLLKELLDIAKLLTPEDREQPPYLCYVVQARRGGGQRQTGADRTHQRGNATVLSGRFL